MIAEREQSCPPERTVPPAFPEWITSELIAETIETWQPYYRESLTVDDAIEILRNVGCLMELT